MKKVLMCCVLPINSNREVETGEAYLGLRSGGCVPRRGPMGSVKPVRLRMSGVVRVKGKLSKTDSKVIHREGYLSTGRLPVVHRFDRPARMDTE